MENWICLKIILQASNGPVLPDLQRTTLKKWEKQNKFARLLARFWPGLKLLRMEVQPAEGRTARFSCRTVYELRRRRFSDRRPSAARQAARTSRAQRMAAVACRLLALSTG